MAHARLRGVLRDEGVTEVPTRLRGPLIGEGGSGFYFIVPFSALLFDLPCDSTEFGGFYDRTEDCADFSWGSAVLNLCATRF